MDDFKFLNDLLMVSALLLSSSMELEWRTTAGVRVKVSCHSRAASFGKDSRKTMNLKV